MRLSRSCTGNCHNNAVTESFFVTPKNEIRHRRRFPTRDAAKHAVIEFVEADYNRRRPHSTIDYQMPTMTPYTPSSARRNSCSDTDASTTRGTPPASGRAAVTGVGHKSGESTWATRRR